MVIFNLNVLMIKIHIMMNNNLPRENKYKKGDMRRNKNIFFKKSFYSKEDSSLSDEDDDRESDS
jgi:phage/plasmid-associated DNA primase